MAHCDHVRVVRCVERERHDSAVHPEVVFERVALAFEPQREPLLPASRFHAGQERVAPLVPLQIPVQRQQRLINDL